MGTNYYAVSPNKRIHLGKSSHGWQFLAKADYEWIEGCALENWLDRVMTSKRIVDEYGDAISKSAFLSMVFRKQSEPTNHTEYIKEHHSNYSGDYWDCDGVNFTSIEFC